MISGLLSAASAMDASQVRHEAISQNLAHLQMPGHRRQMPVHSSRESRFSDEMHQAVNFESQGVHTAEKMLIDFTPGFMERTQNPLDMAIQGEGFFSIQGPEGTLFTRNGAFQLGQSGNLLTADGLQVLGPNGPITFPPNTDVSSIRVAMDGTITAENNPVGKLHIVTFSDLQKLEPAGATLYSAPQDLPPTPIPATVSQNTRERSNASPIQELVDLIATQRQHEAAQKSMTTLSESIGKYLNMQGR
ncbi:flagellar hook-basal body protein [Planctomicrobium sp. SH668]|uniref:flagellar hook-basal body protein n=1 Tax=Planctomicrobium sp. SH668 TaxID=3448126 RepID=UPI003F5B567F